MKDSYNEVDKREFQGKLLSPISHIQYSSYASTGKTSSLKSHTQHPSPVLDEGTIVSGLKDIEKIRSSSGTNTWAFLHVIVAMTAVSCSYPLGGLVLNQWIYKTYSYQLLGNSSGDIRTDPCFNSSSSVSNLTHTKLVQRVQEMSSQMNLYLDLTGNGISMLACVVLGAVARKISRRQLFLIPTTAYVLKLMGISAVIYFNLDLDILYAAYVIYGLGGGSCGIYMSGFLYTSDVTPSDKRRTMGVAIVESVKGVIYAGMTMASGYQLQKLGFFWSSVCCVGIVLIAMTIICCLPDLRQETVDSKESMGILERVISPFMQGSRQERNLLLLASTCFFLNLLISAGVYSFQTLFLMNLPFCLDSITIGWIGFARDISAHVFTVVGFASLSRYFPGVGMALLGVFSQIGGYLTYGFATEKLDIFAGSVVSLGTMLPIAVLRGETSRLCGSDQQGPLWASLAVLESISFTIAAPIFLPVYRATQNFVTGTGTGYLLASFMLLLVVVVLVIYQVKWLTHTRGRQYHVLEVTPDLDKPGNLHTSQVKADKQH